LVEVLLIIIGLVLFSALVLMLLTFFGSGLFVFVGAIVGLLVGIVGGAMLARAAYRRIMGMMLLRRSEARHASAMKAARHDPVRIAEAHDPDSKTAVQQASARISLLRGIAKESTDVSVVDALVLADVRAPDLMRRCVAAIDACADDEERRRTARKALLAYIEIGEQVEEARKRILSQRDDDLDTNLRYLAARSGDDRILTAID
jgi:hypothetical protein